MLIDAYDARVREFVEREVKIVVCVCCKCNVLFNFDYDVCFRLLKCWVFCFSV